MRNARTLAWVAGWIALACTGCQRSQERSFMMPSAGALREGNLQSGLHAGPGTPVPRNARNPFEGDEEAIGQGKRLFNQFNCSGCHSAGGGGMGPALMDDKWVYGSSSANIYWTLVEGRPQGMPSFAGRITEADMWRLAAYVRSLSNLPPEREPGAPQAPAEAKPR